MQRVAPPFIEPMLAKNVAELPRGDPWVYEVKWDGYRVLISVNGDRVKLLSRKDNDLTRDYPSIAAAALDVKADSALIDGELVALDEKGRPSFQRLQNRATEPSHLAYYAFDLLQLNGKPLADQPLMKRRAQLSRVIAGTALRESVFLSGGPDEIIVQISKLQLEGIVAKQRASRYESGGRSGAWVKFKLSPEQEFVIGGFKPALRGVESLVVGFYEKGKLRCAGSVRQGLNPRNRIQLAEKLSPLITTKCPFVNLPTAKTGHWGEGITAEKMSEYRWVKPKLVAQVSFVEWTRQERLRHATFEGLRDEKAPKEVHKEN